ncbi:hypothetical protein [Thermoactinomyces sp. DSM 45892]|uniref:head-tail connector protein n=1 Tax=Thermoactinomyces sp. DSM 45892 TaxID=1882753 RepID=UPI00089A4C60|nr:hypothetical protein [Thermoactinomyces sp. DSM 45892]SDY69379.1 phage conserved hypothetical protein, phiE125 gp8 family [Thermoactinomyces sp. DSM 45892]
MKIKVIEPPTIEPVSLGEVKAQLRYEVDDTSPDIILKPLIMTAREWAEGYMNRAFISQTLEIALDEWRDFIILPRPPLIGGVVVTYTDELGVTEIWDSSNYIVDDFSFVSRIVKKDNVSFPSVPLAKTNGIQVRYVSGYGSTPESVPQRIRTAITILAMHYFENGLSDPPSSVYSLLNLDRVVPV